MAEPQLSEPLFRSTPSSPQLYSDGDSSITAFTSLLGGGAGRSRAYSQSHQPKDDENEVPLRRGSASRISGTEKGYGTVPYNMKQDGLPAAWTIWNSSPGRIRKRIFGLAGVLFFGSGILWLLARSYCDSADYEFENIHKPAPTLSHVNPSAHAEKNEYIHLVTLPFNIHSPPKSPNPPEHKKPGDRHFRRLILIGDVHGAYDELKELLEKVKFDSTGGTDHVVFTGDIVAKGPKSGKVLDLLRELEDKGVGNSVRGNHDDRVLKAYHRLHRNSKDGGDEVDEEEEGVDEEEEEEAVDGDDVLEEIHGNLIEAQGKRRQRKRASDESVAKTLTSAQAKYLAGCPLILRIPRAGHKGGELLVVHAGIVPGTPLLKQDPKLLMNMRTILPPGGNKGKGGDTRIGKGSSTRKGQHWASIWNEWVERQIKGESTLGEEGMAAAVPEVSPEILLKEIDKEREQGITVVYGHYAARGLDLRTWTKGLDSNCVRGGALSALIVEPKKDKEKGGEGDVEMEVVSVKCKKYVN